MTEILRELTSHYTMSICHMPSLKSSVGSKSTGFQPSGGAAASGEAGGRIVFREDTSTVLRSPWISRLRLTPTPAAACGRDGIHSPCATVSAPAPPVKHTVSTNESRTPSSSVYNLKSFIVRSYLGFSPGSPPPAPKLRRNDREDEEDRLVASFGPFQVRTPRKSTGSYRPEGRIFEKGAISGGGCFPLFRRMACLGDEGEEEVGEGRKLGIFEKKVHDEPIGTRPSPAIFQFRPQLSRTFTGIHDRDELGKEEGIADLNPHRSARFMDTDLVSSSRNRQREDENTLQKPCPITDSPFIRVREGRSPTDAWIASASNQQSARSRGFPPAYHEVYEDPSVYRNFQNIHNQHHNIIPQQPDRQVCVIEAEEPFSFWNMGRFKRTNFVSSVAPSLGLACDFSKKRKPRPIDITTYKFRRLGGEH